MAPEERFQRSALLDALVHLIAGLVSAMVVVVVLGVDAGGFAAVLQLGLFTGLWHMGGGRLIPRLSSRGPSELARWLFALVVLKLIEPFELGPTGLLAVAIWIDVQQSVIRWLVRLATGISPWRATPSTPASRGRRRDGDE